MKAAATLDAPGGFLVLGETIIILAAQRPETIDKKSVFDTIG